MLLCALIHIEGKPVGKCKSSPPKGGKVATYRKKFLFVNATQPPPIQNGGETRPNAGNSNCPWVWDTSFDTARKPMVIAKAKCTPDLKCDAKRCREIVYNHQVLRQHKDCETGESVWKWEFEPLPIAYVYDV